MRQAPISTDAGYFRGLGVPPVYQAHDTYVDRAGRIVGRISTGKWRSPHFTSARSDQRLLPLKGESFRESLLQCRSLQLARLSCHGPATFATRMR